MKKILSFILLITMLMSVLSISVYSANNTISYEYNGFVYQVLPDNTVSIEKYKFNTETVEIPSEIEGHKVSTISTYAFYNFDKLKYLTVPDTIEKIESGAFHGTSIDEETSNWYGCGLYAGNHLLYITDDNDGSYSVREGTKTIADKALYNENISEIVLPDSLTRIGDYSFDGCSKLTKVKLSQSLKYIGKYAFRNCDSLENIELPVGLKEIGASTFYNCDNLKDIEIPPTVKSIGNMAFGGCEKFENIVIPEGVETIGSYGFSYCYNLVSISLPQSLKYISNYLFYECKALQKVNVPEKATSIGNSAFYNCSKIENIYIYNSECSLFPSSRTIDSATTIMCKENSKALEYAIEYGKKYNVIEDEHNWCNQKIIKKPTCTEDGEIFRICADCGLREYAILKSTGHRVAYSDTIESTCTNTGITKGEYCSECGEILIEQKTVKRKSHREISKTVYFSNGYKTVLTCKDCGKVRVRDVTYIKGAQKIPTFTVSAGKRKFTVKYNKIDKNSDGCQIKYVKGNTLVIMKYNSVASAVRTYKKIPAGTYKVYMRTYKKSGNRTYYSPWSKAKKLKVR